MLIIDLISFLRIQTTLWNQLLSYLEISSCPQNIFRTVHCLSSNLELGSENIFDIDTLYNAIKIDPITYDNCNSRSNGVKKCDSQCPSQLVKIDVTYEGDTEVEKDALEFGNPSQAIARE